MKRLSVEIVRRIERLREAAQEHGEVLDLLEALAASFEIEHAAGDRSRGLAARYVQKRHAAVIEAALHAAAFAAFDRCGGA